MHLRSGLHTEPHCGSLQCSFRPTSLLSKNLFFTSLIPAFGLEFHGAPDTNFCLCPWVLWAVKVAAKGSASKKTLKNTDIDFGLHGQTQTRETDSYSDRQSGFTYQIYCSLLLSALSSVLWHCCLDDRKHIWPVKTSASKPLGMVV